MPKITMELPNLRAMEVEWERWRELCGLLKDAGAVTEQDGNSPLDARETPGQQLFQAIREWGEALVVLRGGQEAR